MKIINRQLGMSKVGGRLPRSVVYVVADPIHEVVQFSVPKFGVEDRLNLEFWDAVHMDDQRGGHDAARKTQTSPKDFFQEIASASAYMSRDPHRSPANPA